MNSTNVEIDVAFIQAKTKLAITLAVGGMVSLIVGMSVLLYGSSEHSEAIFKTTSFEISASGLGGVVMATSAFWAFFAYKCRPIYSRIQEASERRETQDELVESIKYASATQAAVRRNPSDFPHVTLSKNKTPGG